MFVLVGVILTPSTSGAAPKGRGKLPDKFREKLRKVKSAAEVAELVNQATGALHNLYQGDIKVSPKDLKALRSGKAPKNRLTKRNALRDRTAVWRTRTIPYEFESQMDSGVTATIEAAIQTFNTLSCVQWNAKTASDTTYIRFTRGVGCFSWVGKSTVQGAQELSIGEGCEYTATILHEMMHAAGFYHEQSRPDRDTYVIINTANIIPGFESQFDKLVVEQGDTLNLAYDYVSVMHYGNMLGSNNNLPTMQAINDPNKQLGNNVGLTALDIEKLKKYYDCSSPASNAWSSWSDWGPCMTYFGNCYKIRQRFCTKVSLSECPGADEYGVENSYQDLSCPCT